MQLVIAEKPSVARSIAGVVGGHKKKGGHQEGEGCLRGGGLWPPLWILPRTVLWTAPGPLKISFARAEWIRPCAKVFAVGENA